MPKLGLLSDTHGRAAITRRAVALLVEAGAQRLLHLGDVGGMAVIDELVVPAATGLLPVHLVFGNIDYDAASLGRYAAGLGMQVDHPMGSLDLGGRELVFLHGDHAEALSAALARGVAYLCHGHTHRVSDQRRGRTRIINPGALFRTSLPTIALLDTEADAVDFLPVPLEA